MDLRSFYNDENIFTDPNTSDLTKDIRTRADILLRDFLIGFVEYSSIKQDRPKARIAFDMIMSREYWWNGYNELSTDKLVSVTVEQLEIDADEESELRTYSLHRGYNYKMLNLPNSYIAKFTLNRFIKCSIMLANNIAAYKFMRYIEKDFGIDRYFIDTDKDLVKALEDEELDWLSVYVDYLYNAKNDKQLRRVFEKLEDYPNYIELKAKVIRYLNEYESEDIKL